MYPSGHARNTTADLEGILGEKMRRMGEIALAEPVRLWTASGTLGRWTLRLWPRCTISPSWTGGLTNNRRSVLNQVISSRMPTRHGGRVVKIASVVLALICVPMSHTQDGDALDEIRAEMARLREENERIRGELDRMNRARDPELDRLMSPNRYGGGRGDGSGSI